MERDGAQPAGYKKFEPLVRVGSVRLTRNLLLGIRSVPIWPAIVPVIGDANNDYDVIIRGNTVVLVCIFLILAL